ncbi:SDR family NAD(P)-dependent oxidoreductase [Microlunatus phosphovorus]|nr:SDR family oxidoreductase [Microlunatus phosphovorus]
MSVALITGGSAGLGRALVTAFAARDWTVITDARRADRLVALRAVVGPRVITIPGDIADAEHRRTLIGEVEALSALDLLIHNASTLGPVPLRPLREVSERDLAHAWTVNAGAPAALSRALLPWLKKSDGVVISLSSDAAVEHYPTWGAYAAGKAALDHLTLTLGAEEGLDTYAVDPGDLRTEMHQAAFPGEDISDRPLPETAVPAFLEIVRRRPPSGRYRAAELSPLEV